MMSREAICALGSAVVFAACSSPRDEPAAVIDAGESATDGGFLAEGATDASVAAARDAAPPPCSIEGFCRADVERDDNLVGVWGDGSGVVWAASTPSAYGGASKIYRWDGTAWAVNAKLLEQTPTAIWGRGPTDIYVCTNDQSGLATVLHGTGPSSNAVTWTATPLLRPAGAVIGSVWGSGDDVWLAGTADNRGFIAHVSPRADGTLDSAIEYLAAGFPGAPVNSLSVVFGSSASDVWAGGAKVVVGPNGIEHPVGLVLHRSVSGAAATWEADTGATTPMPIGGGFTGTVSGTGIAPGKVALSVENFPGGCGGVVFNTTPAWTNVSVAPPVCQHPRGLWGTENDLWVVGEGGLVREWDGATWRLARTAVDPAPIFSTLNAIWGSGPDDFWIVGNAGVVLHKTKAAMR